MIKKLLIRMMRELQQTKGQFWSMVFVIAAGSALLAGMLAAQESMTESVNHYFESQNMADVWCYFKGITKSEINELFAATHIRAAEGRYAYIAHVEVRGANSELIIRSITGINQSLLSAGEMPNAKYEIMVDNKYAEANDLSIGDTVLSPTASGDKVLTITGFCYNPEAVVVRKNEAPASVSHAVLGVAYGTDETLIDFNRSTTAYQTMLQSVYDQLEEGRRQLSDADNQIAEAWSEYENEKQKAESELSGAEATLEDSQHQLQEGAETLSSRKMSAEEQFASSQKKLDDAAIQLEETKKQAESEFADGKKKLDDARKLIDDSRADLDKQKAEAQTLLTEGQKLIDDGKSELEASQEAGEKELADAQTKLADARQKIDSEKASVEKQESEALAQLTDGQKQIDAAQAKLNSEQKAGEAQLAEGQTQLNEAKKVIDDGEAEIKRHRDEGAALQAAVDTLAEQVSNTEKQLNAAYLFYQSTTRPGLSLSARREEDARYAGQFTALEQQKKELATKQNNLSFQLSILESMLAPKVQELNEGKALYEKSLQEFQAKKATAMQALAAGQNEINANQQTLDAKKAEAETKLPAAKAELEKAEKEYQAGLAEYNSKKADGEAKILAAQTELDSKQKELNRQKLEGETKLKDGETQLAKAETDYQAELKSYQAKRTDADTQFADAGAEIASQQQSFDEQWKQGLNTIANMEQKMADSQRQYEEGLDEYTRRKEDAENQLNDAKTEIAEQEQIVSEKKAEFADSEAETEVMLETAATSYQEVLLLTTRPDATSRLAKSNENFIAAIERKNHISYIAVDDSLHPIRSLSFIFPIIFFMVAAVIAFISISKMVDAQRTQIAVMIAIGVSRWKIQCGFLLYAFAAATLGTVAFTIIGNIALPRYLIGVLTTNLDVPQIDVSIYPVYIAIILPLSFLFTGLAVMLATRKVFSQNPSTAMKPVAPGSGKNILLEKIRPIWTRLSATGKMAFRFMFRNKVRVILSSIGVIGSVALLTAGFSIHSMAAKVMDSTYNSLNYDLLVDFDGPLEDKSTIELPVDVVALEYTDVRLATMKVANEAPVRVQIMENGSRMIVLFDENGKEIPFQQDSCIIPQNIAEENGLRIGDPLSIEIGTDTYSFTITGVNEQIFSKRVYLGESAAYASGIQMAKNMIFVKLKETIFTDRVMAGFQENIHVTGVSTKNNQVALAREVMSMLNALIAIIILASSILAITVIYNITSVNIMERTRDYATMMALGYTIRQVNKIIIMENVTLTLFGAAAGSPLGYVLYEYLRNAVTRDDLTIGKDLTPFAAIGAVLVSFGLTALTNWVLRGKIQRIQLVQTLKAQE